MMGDVWKNSLRPRCCKCGSVATGRICYAGNPDNVVDNPFCNSDFPDVYFQTGILLDELFKIQAIGDWVLVQRWKYTEAIPLMPLTTASLMIKGQKRR